MNQDKQKWNPGDILEIPLGNGQRAFARIKKPLMAFYDLMAERNPTIDSIVSKPIAFKVWVKNHSVTDGKWPIIGTRPLTPELEKPPTFFKRDPISGKLSVYNEGGREKPATVAECDGLECAAVSDPNHVIDRLKDHFAKKPNKWVESMKPR